MFRVSVLRWSRSLEVVLLLAGVGVVSCPSLAKAQGFVTAVPSRARVFPEINSGVTAMKRDSAGRYYVLATPPNLILILSPGGKKVGQIPVAGPDATQIQFAVDFDFDATGRVLVADRAANAVEVFTSEGLLVAKIPIFAPTGVVALPDKQFAVSTLRSKRLIEIRTEQGNLVRSFGDPAEAGADPNSKQLQNLGKISGDGNGDIYFAFIAVPDPTVRKYDRYGYAAGEATFAASRYEPGLTPSPDDRVQFGVNFSDTNFSDSYNTWAAVGNKGDILFGGGLSPGLGSHLGGAPATAQSATNSILSTGLANGPGGGGAGGMAGGGMVSAQGSYQGDSLQLHVGGKYRQKSSNSSGGSNDDGKSREGSADGGIFQFTAQDLSSNDSSNPDDSAQALFSFAQPNGDPPVLNSAVPGGGALSVGMRGAGGGSGGEGMFGGMGLFPGLAGFGRVGGTNFAGGIGGGFLFRDTPQGTPGPSATTAAPSTPTTPPAPATGAAAGATTAAAPTTPGTIPSHAGTAAHTGEEHIGGSHGHYGRDLYNFTGTVKVNLDHFSGASDDKPVITAVGIDPISHDIWAAIGRVLAHFDKNGAYVADYYVTTPEGAPLHASAIIVEPDRLLVASDSRGVFEFARPDSHAAGWSVQGAVAPKQSPAEPAAQQ